MQSEKDEQAENAEDQDKAMDWTEKPVLSTLYSNPIINYSAELFGSSFRCS